MRENRPACIRFTLVLAILLCFAAVAGADEHTWEFASPNAVAQGTFGTNVAAIPGLSGTGRDGFAVSAVGEKVSGLASAGRVYVYGANQALRNTLVSPNPQANANFGFSVGYVPDVDGDGVPDVLVGASQENAAGVVGGGRVHVYSGLTGTLIRTLISPNNEPNGGFGVAVAGLHDVNGDGKGEILVGAITEDSTTTNGGRAYLFSGAGSLIAQLESPNKQTDGDFGDRVAAVPDVDGDGKEDYVVAAWKEKVGLKIYAGHAYLFSSATNTVIRTLTSPNPAAGNNFIQNLGNFGCSVAGISDIDGDGKGDIIVGAWRDLKPGTASTTGRAYIFSGATGASIRAYISPLPEANAITGNFGISVAAVHDHDGDGKDDIVVGSWGDDAPTTNTGRAYVFSSKPALTQLATLVSPKPTPTDTILGLAVYGNFGSSVAGLASPIPGYPGTILVGAPSDKDNSAVVSGKAYLFDLHYLVTGAKDWTRY